MTLAPLRSHDRLFVDGEWMEPRGGDRIEVVSPWSEQTVGSVPAASAADVDRAVVAARRAFDTGPWPRTPLSDRIAVLRRVRDGIEARRDELAALVTEEMGSPIAQSGPIQIGVPLTLLDSYLQVAQEFTFEGVRSAASGTALVAREPVGVVAAVVPWNVPLTVTLQKLAPALLTGCTVVLKPAPETPLTAFALADIVAGSGLPAGALSVLPAGREVSEYLVGHPGVDKVAFTGSTAAGRRIAAVCGEQLKRVTLELGGKSAAVVLDDADLDRTVAALKMGSLRNSGQICSLKTRILVSRRVHDEFVDRLSAMVSGMPVGDPHDPTTEIGPMVTARQRDVVTGYVEAGRQDGARIVLGGGPAPVHHGWFVDPTVFTDVTPDMRIAREEIFGPVLAVLPYDTEDEAVALANDSVYGLNGAVFGGDPEHALAVARRIRTGTVEINGSSAGFLAPMGGVKDSGIGREAGPEGLESYLEPKSYGLPAELADRLT